LLAAFGMGDWTGALIRVAPDGTRTEIASEGLFAPGSVTLGADGAFYVTNQSIFSGTGEVVKNVT
jgi:sugar lactone lactonase YvrE